MMHSYMYVVREQEIGLALVVIGLSGSEELLQFEIELLMVSVAVL